MAQDNGLANATVRRWQLTETLRRLREEAGLTHDQVIAELRKGQGKWSRPKLSRIENREQGVKIAEVEQLLDVYQVADRDLRAWLADLASTGHERGWIVDLRKTCPRTSTPSSTWKSPLSHRGASKPSSCRGFSKPPTTRTP
ncbi:helix-turn-helix domain-containing protein [Saccharopolyspora hattusasensis]|uniref:helix-turn-helix domain-containing protein n=1 Tax=Saccharopolyspora hattusasensis TaxID=1128679 RepID=UPI003D97AFEA